MPRRPRVVLPGVAHHITQRGNNHERVFHAAAHYHRYLDLLYRYAPRGGVRILAYCLMPDHIHLVAVPEQADSLALTLDRVHSECALAWNGAGDRSGRLWEPRSSSCALQESQAVTALRFVDLNPVRAGLAAAAWDWPWSSARAHADRAALDLVLDSRWTEYFGRWDFPEWKEILSAGIPDGDLQALRCAACHSVSGRPTKRVQLPPDAASRSPVFALAE